VTFTLCTNSAGGTPTAGPITNLAAAVSNGLFATTINFAADAFTGASNWLQIGVRTNGGGLSNLDAAQLSTGVVPTSILPGFQASSNYSTVGGGSDNTASAESATVPGGANNSAGGQYSLAAGENAQANNNNSFVWGDGTRIATSQAANSFNVLATGGVYFYDGPGGVYLSNIATAWTSISDRNAKKNLQPVDTVAVLDKLAAIPVQQWNYKWEKDNDPPNIGPMAQDFKAALYPGRDDTGISTLEFDGVELAAIQGVNRKVEDLKTENAGLREQNAALEKRLQALEQLVQSLADGK